jgi:hypothetical protein
MNKGNQLAKDAIAEAKVIRATALEQAKLALEEAFTPHLQSILAAKLNELEEDDDVYESEEEKMDEMIDLDALLAEEESKDEKEESEDEESEDKEEMDDEDMDISSMSPKEVEDYIRQIAAEEFEKLEAGEHEEGGEEDEEETEAPEEETDDDEEINLDEIFNESEDDMDSIDESDDINIDELLAEFGLSEEKEEEEYNTEMEEELYEARSTIKELRSTLHEVNLLNSKLLYMNKVFKANNLTESQKIQIVKTFDKTESVKEVKLVYESLNSTLTKKETNRSSIKESLGFASKPSGLITQTNNSKVIDSDIQIDRWAKLAGLK